MTESATSITPEHEHDSSADRDDSQQSTPMEHSSAVTDTSHDLDSLDTLHDGTHVEQAPDQGPEAAGAGASGEPGVSTADRMSEGEEAFAGPAPVAVDRDDEATNEATDEATNEGAEGVAGADDPEHGASDVGTPRRSNRVRLLEKEGEVAADFLERLLDIADLDGDIEVDIDGDRAAVAIVDSEDGRVPRRLVGADGKVLEALQELTRLAVQAETGERSRLMLDVAGHRAQRRTTLVELAQTAIAEVKTTGAKKALDDMSAFERKIVHDEVAASGLESESEGVEPHRHIVVFPV